jgi:hypothetical protein
MVLAPESGKKHARRRSWRYHTDARTANSDRWRRELRCPYGRTSRSGRRLQGVGGDMRLTSRQPHGCKECRRQQEQQRTGEQRGRCGKSIRDGEFMRGSGSSVAAGQSSAQLPTPRSAAHRPARLAIVPKLPAGELLAAGLAPRRHGWTACRAASGLPGLQCLGGCLVLSGALSGTPHHTPPLDGWIRETKAGGSTADTSAPSARERRRRIRHGPQPGVRRAFVLQ